jgi:hypothetical protein
MADSGQRLLECKLSKVNKSHTRVDDERGSEDDAPAHDMSEKRHLARAFDLKHALIDREARSRSLTPAPRHSVAGPADTSPVSAVFFALELR